MPTFQYVARDASGRSITGTQEAPSPSAVVRLLREKSLTPTTIEEVRGRAVRKRKLKRGRIKIEDLVIVSRQLATMIRAGLPLLEVLNILGEQVEKVTMRDILNKIEKDVQGGSSLTEAMVKHPQAFNQFFVSMVRAGEASGMLDTILDQVATYLEKLASLQRKVKSAVVYPAVVSVVAVGITIFLMVKVVPVFKDIFEGFDAQLPTVTAITITISDAIRDHYIMLFLATVGIAIGLHYWGKTKTGRWRIDSTKLVMPIFGPIFLKVGIAKFTRTLGVLLRSGVNILSALEITGRTAGNVVIEEAIAKTKASIQSGESIAKPLADCGVFPPMVTRMIDVGERTGALESMLTKIADFYEDQVDATVAGLTSLIEPLLICFLGVVVGFIVISMFLPLITMLDHLN
ncbi:MAG: type II secretion system F family protein [Candidatus Sumerlaeia bacterium]|nr:type II secretion system F family protein [Candidatus Sumerlaeia bacterium]